MGNIISNLCDTAGKIINETFIDTSDLRRQLRGFRAVDKPLSSVNGGNNYQTNMDTRKQQIDKQLIWTLQERNTAFDRIDSIARHHLAITIKDIIISDGFNDVNNGNTLFIKYSDPDNEDKAALFTEEIQKMIKRTNFLDILRDAIFCEGLDYGELFLSKVQEPGRGIIEVIDDVDLRQHVAIYSKAELLGAVKFSTKSSSKGLNGNFIKADEIAHFMLNYRRVPLEIKVGKGFNTISALIKEKIRCAEPILSPVVDLIKQYNQLEQISTAIEIARAVQPILLGVGVSPEQDIGKIAKQLQEWSAALNKNKNNIITNLDSLDITTLLKSMQSVELIPYDVENNTNAMKQIQLNYGDADLSQKINDLRKTIALAVGVPEQYISTSTYMGQKDTKEDTIQTNPRYSMMLSRIQQLLAKGIREFCYSHLRSKYSNAEGVATRTVEKDKIEVIFKSCTNLNDRLENENMLLRTEAMSNILTVLDEVAGSPHLHFKVEQEHFLSMWKEQLRNNPPLRDIFSAQNNAEIDQQRSDLGLPDTNGSSVPKINVPIEQPGDEPSQEQSKEPEEKDEKQEARDKSSEQAKKKRKYDQAKNDGEDGFRSLLN